MSATCKTRQPWTRLLAPPSNNSVHRRLRRRRPELGIEGLEQDVRRCDHRDAAHAKRLWLHALSGLEQDPVADVGLQRGCQLLVEDDLAGPQLRDRGRVPAAEARSDRRVGQGRPIGRAQLEGRTIIDRRATCLLYPAPRPRYGLAVRMPSSACKQKRLSEYDAPEATHRIDS